MNTKQFYKHLDELKKQRWMAKVTKNGWIRLREPGGGRYIYTPMTAVCLKVKTKRFHWLKDVQAGIALALARNSITILHRASFGESEFRREAIYRCLNIVLYEREYEKE